MDDVKTADYFHVFNDFTIVDAKKVKIQAVENASALMNQNINF